MIVVDASVLVEALLVGGRAADRLAEEDLAAPHLLDAPLVTADAALATCPGLRTSVEVLPL